MSGAKLGSFMIEREHPSRTLCQPSVRHTIIVAILFLMMFFFVVIIPDFTLDHLTIYGGGGPVV